MDFDVIVSGAGLTGSATALALHQKGFRVALIKASDPATSEGRFGHDLRTLAISPVNVNWFKTLDFEDSIFRYPVERMQVWEHDGSGLVTFDAHTVGLTSLASIFEHSPLIEACRTKIQKDVEVFDHTQIVELDSTNKSVQLSKGLSISCKLLCIAEGPNSRTREIAGSAWESQELGHSALVTLARTEHGHRNTAWQKFGDGILAFLPFEGNLVSVIWSMDDARCQQLLSFKDDEFAKLLTETSERVCGKIVEIDERKAFSLKQSLASTFCPKSWVVVIGDAAHTLHPLSGQGVNLGLEDARTLVNYLGNESMGFFNPASLTRFAHKRRLKARQMLFAMAFFLNAWSWKRPGFRWVRNVGIRAFNRVGFIKHQVMREAVGFGALGSLD